MKAIPFINTMLDDQYRVLVLREFFQKDILENFEGWNEKDMVGWTKFLNFNDRVTFEFYGEGNPYKIKNPNLNGDKSFTLPYPKNLDQFICDCQRCYVSLHWQKEVINGMNRVIFMNQLEIENYNKELLIKIEKE